MDWRTLEEGIPLQRLDGSAVLNTFGARVLTSITWPNPDNITQLGSALRAIHQKFDHRGAYQGVCCDCLKEQSALPPIRMGCDRHAPQPQIWRKGNPTQSILFENAFKQDERLQGYWRYPTDTDRDTDY